MPKITALKQPEPPAIAVLERAAFKKWEAANYLRISTKQLWRRMGQGKIRATIDGTISRAECDRYLAEEMVTV